METSDNGGTHRVARYVLLSETGADAFQRVEDDSRAEAALMAMYGCRELGIAPGQRIAPVAGDGG